MKRKAARQITADNPGICLSDDDEDAVPVCYLWWFFDLKKFFFATKKNKQKKVKINEKALDAAIAKRDLLRKQQEEDLNTATAGMEPFL